MPGLVDLKRQNARGTYPSNLDWQNLRRQNYGFIDTALRNTPVLMTQRNIEVIENSWGAPNVEIPVFSKNVGTATVGTMTCSFIDDDAVAQFAQILFVKAKVGFRVIPRLSAQSDVVSEDVDFMRQFSDKEEALANFLEEKIQLSLDAVKATTYNSAFVGAGAKFPLAGDALQVDQADQQFFWNYMTSIMKADNFNGSNLDMICSPEIDAFFNQYINQGQGNNQNSNFQFGPYTNTVSNSTPVSAGALGTGYIFPRGSMAIVGRTSPDAKAQARAEGPGIMWTEERSDLLGIPIELMTQELCEDVSTITDNADDTNAFVKKYQMAINCAVIMRFDESTNNGVKKFDFLP